MACRDASIHASGADARLIAGNPEAKENEGWDERNEQIERDHAGTLAPAVAQGMSPDAPGREASWHIGGGMIRNDKELAITRERMAMFERMLAELRKTARPQEWQDLSSGYRLEIERMQREVLDYLVH